MSVKFFEEVWWRNIPPGSSRLWAKQDRPRSLPGRCLQMQQLSGHPDDSETANLLQRTSRRNTQAPQTQPSLGLVWELAGSGADPDSWRRELPPVVPGIEPLLVFKRIGWPAVSIWFLLAKLSHKSLNTDCLLGQEHDLFIYYLFTLFW